MRRTLVEHARQVVPRPKALIPRSLPMKKHRSVRQTLYVPLPVFCCFCRCWRVANCCGRLPLTRIPDSCCIPFLICCGRLLTETRGSFVRKSLSQSLLCKGCVLVTPTNSASPVRKRTKSEFVHLRSLPGVEPQTSTGRVAWIWPEIEAALTTGKKLREVWDAARADGLDIPYPQFRVYVSRIRRRQSRQRRSQTAPPPAASAESNASPLPPPNSADPYRNLREQREKKQSDEFHFDPFSIQKQLID